MSSKVIFPVLFIFLVIELSYSQNNRIVLHFYRDSDFWMVHRGARIKINDELALVLPKNSYDTITISNLPAISSVQVQVGKENYKIYNNSNAELYFYIQYKPTVFLVFGKFSIIQVNRDFFMTRVRLINRKKGVKTKYYD